MRVMVNFHPCRKVRYSMEHPFKDSVQIGSIPNRKVRNAKGSLAISVVQVSIPYRKVRNTKKLRKMQMKQFQSLIGRFVTINLAMVKTS